MGSELSYAVFFLGAHHFKLKVKPAAKSDGKKAQTSLSRISAGDLGKEFKNVMYTIIVK